MEGFWEHFRLVLMLLGYILVGCFAAEFIFQIWKYDLHVPIRYVPEIVAWILYYCGVAYS